MRRLRGSLNVAQLKGAFEDNTDVHIVMEWCRGGELWHRIGRAHYSERTVRAPVAEFSSASLAMECCQMRNISMQSAIYTVSVAWSICCAGNCCDTASWLLF